MNKASLVVVINEIVGCTMVDSEKAIDAIITAITDTLNNGDAVSISGLGIFSAKQRAARTARNPRTGEAIQVPAMRVPKFRAAKALKDAVR